MDNKKLVELIVKWLPILLEKLGPELFGELFKTITDLFNSENDEPENEE
jgi:hypothetical protein